MNRMKNSLNFPILLLVTAIAASGCQDDGSSVSPGDEGALPLFTESSSFAPCFDGHVAHNTSNCTSCAGSDFTFSTTANAATVKEDLGQSDMCGESHAVFIFNTSSLTSKCEIQSATFSFKVKSLAGLDVDQVRVRIYAQTVWGPSCPTSLGFPSFVDCGSGYSDLGLVTITGTGTVNFSIPNPNNHIASIVHPDIEPFGIKFVVVDESVYTSGVGQQETKIHSVEASSASDRPTLSVVAYDCFTSCIDGNALHNFQTECDKCFSSEFTFDTASGTMLLEHYEPAGDGCGVYKTGALHFNTTSLDDEDEIVSAKLVLYVTPGLYESISKKQIRVYGVEDVASCPGALSSTDSPFCNENATSLGEVEITAPGFYKIAIPNPGLYVNREGASTFLLTDASQTSGEPAFALTYIYSNEVGFPQLRPRLQVQY